MSSAIAHDDSDNKSVELEPLTHPPLLDKHFQIDIFSNSEVSNDPQNDGNANSTQPTIIDDAIEDSQQQLTKKVEPVLGKERAIKILKAFGSQQKPVKEFYTNVLKTPTKDSNKPKKERKSLTPMEKAKETISQIEELKKFKDHTIPTYFGENVVIHHIKVPTIVAKVENNITEDVEKIEHEPVGVKATIDSLEALKVYNNLDVDKQSDDDDINHEENVLYDALNNHLLEASMKKAKLPGALELKAKRSKEKRKKRNSLDSRSSDKKQRRRHKERKKKKSRDSSSKRSSTSGKRSSKKKRKPNRDTEQSTDRLVPLESQNKDFQFERYTKTLPVIKYSVNPQIMRKILTNGIGNKNIDKESRNKKKKRSSSKSKLEKEKRKKSRDRNSEKGKVKERPNSGVKKRRKEFEKNLENPKVKKQKISECDLASKKKGNKANEKSPNSEEYHSNWDNWSSWDAADEMAGGSMEDLLPLDTIPLQLNVPKQDRTILFINDCTPKTSEEMNQTTPRMSNSDSAVETPNNLNFTQVKCQESDLEDFEKEPLNKAPRLGSDNSLDKYITKISPRETIRKNEEQPKLKHQPIAQLYDEYEQFIMSCMPTEEGSNQNNGDKSSAASSLFDENVSSNDGEDRLEALKTSLEKKLHEIERTDLDGATKVKTPETSAEIIRAISPKPFPLIAKEPSDSSSSSSSSSSSDSSSSSSSSSSDTKQRKKKSRKHSGKSKMALKLAGDIFNLETGIEDDQLSDDELLSKVEQLKQQLSEKRKAIANKRKLVENNSESPDPGVNLIASDALLVSTDKRSAISLKFGGSKPNAIRRPVMLDDDDFTEKLLLEVTPIMTSFSKETNVLSTDRVIKPGRVSPSTSISMADESINTKIYRIGMTSNNLMVKSISTDSIPISTSEMKNYLNNAVSLFDSSDSITSKTSGSIDSVSSSSEHLKISPLGVLTPSSRSDKKDRPLSPYQRSHTKESSKRHFSPEPLRHRSPRPRKRSSHRTSSPIRKRSRGSPRRSRTPRKSPRRLSPRRIRRSLSPRPKRTVSPIRGRPRTPPMPETHANRKWEPPLPDYKSSAKNVCDNNEPQQICRIECTPHSTPWPDDTNSEFAQYEYQHIRPMSPKRSLDERIAHAFNQSDQSYDFHQASTPYMGQYQYSTENASKIPVLNSQENYYFPPHLPPQNIPTLPSQPLPPQHVPRQHVPPLHVQHAPNQLSPLPVQHAPPQQRTFPNLIEIRQSNVDVVPQPIPFVVKGNVLEIVPKTEEVEPLIDSALIKVEDESCNDNKQEIKIELTEEEMERREFRKAELKLKRKQERDKRQLERFMRKEKLKLEIKHLMEVGVHTAEIKKATYNPNAVGGKSILRLNASSSNKKSVLFADGVAPGDGTSTSGGEDMAPLLRDRNKRMTKRKLDSKRRRARREASVIKKDVAPQAMEITPFIDPELENMPPPLPPDGNPPSRLAQPKLKSAPKLIYFHYDPRSNAMYVSPFPTTQHIPRELDQPKPSIDSPRTSSTPDLIQKPKVCFIQPPVFDQQPPQVPVANPSLQNANHNALILNNSVSSTDLQTPLLPLKPFNQQHQPPLPNSLPTSPALYPSHPTHSPQNYRGPVPINQPTVPIQPAPIQIQLPPMAPQWENVSYQTNTQIPPLQQPPCPKSWETDAYLHNQPIRPHTRFNNANNLAQQRPPHIPWDQQRHPNPMFQNPIPHPPHSPHPPQQPPPPFHPRPNHPRFHPNNAVNVNPPHQQHNKFIFNANYTNYNANSNQSWNHQYRNNH